MPTTSPDNIFYADTSTSMDVAVISAAEANSVQAALTARITTNRQIQTYRWANAAARIAQTGMAEGDVGDQADTDQRWRYSGATWGNITVGLFPVIPTGASGATVVLGTSGKVSFTAATSVSIDGCFTTTYDNYVVIIDMTHSAANTFSIRLRGAGVDNSAAQYSSVSHYASGTTAAVASAPSDTGMKGYFVATRVAGSISLFGPALAATTLWQLDTTAILTATTMGIFKQGGEHTVSTAFDGITFIPVAGTITGSIRIEGWNNN